VPWAVWLSGLHSMALYGSVMGSRPWGRGCWCANLGPQYLAHRRFDGIFDVDSPAAMRVQHRPVVVVVSAHCSSGSPVHVHPTWTQLASAKESSQTVPFLQECRGQEFIGRVFFTVE
jgi:hypothetical protein